MSQMRRKAYTSTTTTCEADLSASPETSQKSLVWDVYRRKILRHANAVNFSPQAKERRNDVLYSAVSFMLMDSEN